MLRLRTRSRPFADGEWSKILAPGRERKFFSFALPLRGLVGLLALAATAGGVTALLGWLLGIEGLLQPWPGFKPISFNTALALIASGGGLWLALRQNSKTARRAALVLGWLVFALGLVTGVEHLLGWNLHIDQLFWNALSIQANPVRMAWETAAFFVFAGLFLILSGAGGKAGAWLRPAAAFAANLLSQVAILNLIFGNRQQAPVLQTAVALLALSLGMLFFPSKSGPLAPLLNWSAGGRILRRLFPAAILGPLITGWAYETATGSGKMNSDFGIILMILGYGAVLVLITVWTANSLDSVDLWLSAVAESSEDAIVGMDAAGRIVTWNHGAETLYGYTAEEAVGHSMRMLTPPDRRPEQRQLLERVLHGESIRQQDTVRLRKDGSLVSVSVSASALRNARGEIAGCSVVARDITAREAAEKEIRELNRNLERRVEQRTAELRESEHRVRRRLDAILSPEGDVSSLELIDVLDLEAIQPLFDDLARLTGILLAIVDLKGNVLVTTPWQDICAKFHRVHPESCKNCVESDCQLSAGVPAGELKIYKCKNNMWELATPIMLGSRHIGNLFTGQYLFDDDPVDPDVFIAQARKYGFVEAEYLAALHRVPRVSRERVESFMRAYSKLASVLSSVGLSRVKLAQSMAESTRANAELKASIAELERFAYSVSHDLRAPLRHLEGFLTLLARRSYAALDEQGKHYIDNTLQASQRMGRLIDELLQFSRLGRAEMRKILVDPNPIVDAVTKELEPESRDRVIRWRIEELPPVMADPTMLRQVFANLLGNALKFTRRRDVAEIRVGFCTGENGEPVISVEDNGAGFDMRYPDKLFQVFQRLHGEDEFEGTGIGLANVRRIVERHGGAVWAEGDVNAGAKFHFSLPQGCGSKGETHEYASANSAD